MNKETIIETIKEVLSNPLGIGGLVALGLGAMLDFLKLQFIGKIFEMAGVALLALAIIPAIGLNLDGTPDHPTSEGKTVALLVPRKEYISMSVTGCVQGVEYVGDTSWIYDKLHGVPVIGWFQRQASRPQSVKLNVVFTVPVGFPLYAKYEVKGNTVVATYSEPRPLYNTLAFEKGSTNNTKAEVAKAVKQCGGYTRVTGKDSGGAFSLDSPDIGFKAVQYASEKILGRVQTNAPVFGGMSIKRAAELEARKSLTDEWNRANVGKGVDLIVRFDPSVRTPTPINNRVFVKI
jgi:hypothetical protein